MIATFKQIMSERGDYAVGLYTGAFAVMTCESLSRHDPTWALLGLAGLLPNALETLRRRKNLGSF